MSKEKDKKISLLAEDLASLESYIRDLFNFSPLPICFVNPIGVILEVNPSFENLAGLESYELIGEPIESLFEKEEIKKIVKDTLSRGFVRDREVSFLRGGKKKITVQAFTKVRRDEKGSKVGYFLCLFDLTKIKEKEEKLKRELKKYKPPRPSGSK